MRSIKSTFGGACSVLGKTLMGLPVANMVQGHPPSQAMIYIWTIGFLIDALGGFFATLFSADKSDVRRLMEETDEAADKKFVTKDEAENDRKDTKTMLRGKADVEDK